MTSDILAVLLPELVIEIFSQLDPASLTRCTAVSRAWRNTIANDLIWKRVATKQLRLCPDGVQAHELATLPSLRRWSASDHFANLTSFRQLCVRWQHVLNGWRGRRDNEPEKEKLGIQDLFQFQHPSEAGVDRIKATREIIWLSDLDEQIDAWRIKTDPEFGTLLVTLQKGGLLGIEIDTYQLIWQLGRQEVQEFTSFEAEKGILIILRLFEDGAPKVWAHRRLFPDGGDGELYQHKSSLHMSEAVVASKFKWPVFCGMGGLGTAFFWDLTNPEQPRQLESIDTHIGDVIDVDFDDQHLFLVGSSFDQVTVYDRATGRVKWSMAAYLRQANAASLIRSYRVNMSDLREDEDAAELASTDFFECKLSQKAIEPSILKVIERFSEDAVGKGTAGEDDADEDRFHWEAVHIEEGTESLLMLAKHILMIVPNFASLNEAHCGAPIMTVEYITRANMSGRPALTGADGRVFFLDEDPILLDLAPHRQVPLTATSMPFRLADDPASPPPMRIFASHDPLRYHYSHMCGCSGAQMDAANIFAEVPVEIWLNYGDEEEPVEIRETTHRVCHWRICGGEELPSTATT
ncbi:hypothetical protein CF326_g424 [Tilletia indica]|uniref:Uncharacterized protein n=1 Tax=Tilletia indica TaxID=43049 RepID=A0A177TUY2_9BASI|nr:hypothetical protein CF326_g424 [Tilletia indica]KAE8250515.1 hypothetical protein A4X13_0g4654 [Tilletia indica]